MEHSSPKRGRGGPGARQRRRGKLAAEARSLRRRLSSAVAPNFSGPVLGRANIVYELSERSKAVSHGGMGMVAELVKKVRLAEELDSSLKLLALHKPYYESDHVLNVAYNALCGGRTLDDIEARRGDQVFLDGIGAAALPDPTTAGDFCRRFDEASVMALQEAVNRARLRGWAAQPASFVSQTAVIDADATIVPTGAEAKGGIDISYNGLWGYSALMVSFANTAEPLYLALHGANRPSHEGVVPLYDRAITLCRQAGFTDVLLRGDTDFSLTTEFDRWDDDGVRFVFGYNAWATMVDRAGAVPDELYHELVARAERAIKTAPPCPPKVKDAIVRARRYKVLRQKAEDVASFSYRPAKCTRDYRVVALRKDLSVENYGSSLYSVSCPSVHYCVAAGFYAGGHMGYEPSMFGVYNGSAWRAELAPSPANLLKGHAAQLDQVQCPSPTACFALGEYEANVPSNATESPDRPFIERGDGAGHFTPQTLPVMTTPGIQALAQINEFSCPSPTFCVAVGTYGSAPGVGQVMAEVFNGVSWHPVLLPPPNPKVPRLPSSANTVSCAAPGHCVMTGVTVAGVRFAETDYLGRWRVKLLPKVPGSDSAPAVRTLTCPTISSCVGVGTYSVPPRPAIVTKSGNTWTSIGLSYPTPIDTSQAGEPSGLVTVSCANPSFCVAGGLYPSSPTQDDAFVAEYGSTATSTTEPTTAPTTTATLPLLSELDAGTFVDVWYSGIHLGQGQACTTGFGVVKQSGGFELLAKHCVGGDPVGYNQRDNSRLAAYSPLKVLTSDGKYSFDAALDCSPPGTSVCLLPQPDPSTTGDFVAFKPDASRVAAKVQTKKGLLPVLGEMPVSNAVGLTACHYGFGSAKAGSAEHCGKVGAPAAIGEICSKGGLPSSGCAGLDSATGSGGPGDSGGPEYVYNADGSGVYALGIVVIADGSDTLFVPMNTIEARLGVSLLCDGKCQNSA